MPPSNTKALRYKRKGPGTFRPRGRRYALSGVNPDPGAGPTWPAASGPCARAERPPNPSLGAKPGPLRTRGVRPRPPAGEPSDLAARGWEAPGWLQPRGSRGRGCSWWSASSSGGPPRSSSQGPGVRPRGWTPPGTCRLHAARRGDAIGGRPEAPVPLPRQVVSAQSSPSGPAPPGLGPVPASGPSLPCPRSQLGLGLPRSLPGPRLRTRPVPGARVCVPDPPPHAGQPP